MSRGEWALRREDGVGPWHRSAYSNTQLVTPNTWLVTVTTHPLLYVHANRMFDALSYWKYVQF